MTTLDLECEGKVMDMIHERQAGIVELADEPLSDGSRLSI